jgi:hypothetical protein
MSDLTEFYLNTRSDIWEAELIEISHPNFTQTYRIARNVEAGADSITVDLSGAETGVEFTYYPIHVQPAGARDDLDASIRLDVGDLGELVPGEIDAVASAGGFMTKPALRYWTYRSDILTEPMYGPLTLEIPQIALNDRGCSIDARAPQLNATKTGERWTLARVQMLLGFVR